MSTDTRATSRRTPHGDRLATTRHEVEVDSSPWSSTGSPMRHLLRVVIQMVKDVGYGINAGHAVKHGLKPSPQPPVRNGPVARSAPAHRPHLVERHEGRKRRVPRSSRTSPRR